MAKFARPRRRSRQTCHVEVGSTRVTQRAALRRRAVRGASMFKHQGLCAANLQGEALDLDAPKELINLDTMHKASTGRRVDAISYGRFSTAPRGKGSMHAVPPTGWPRQRSYPRPAARA